MARKKLTETTTKFNVGDIVTNIRDIGVALEEIETSDEVLFEEAIIRQVMEKRFPYGDSCYYRVEITTNPLNNAFKRKYSWIESIVLHEGYMRIKKDLYSDPEVFI